MAGTPKDSVIERWPNVEQLHALALAPEFVPTVERALPASQMRISVGTVPQASWYDATKRTIDVTIGLLLLFPMLFVVAVAAVTIAVVYRTNPFFLQRRTGLFGQEFTMVKLKTMFDGADSVVPLELNETGGITFKARKDPRITPIGRLLRRASIDEFPQIVNVLAGHMSLVGPRPPLPREVACYSRCHWERLAVKPGLTGLWQVSGRSDLSFHRSVAIDRVYVRKRCLFLDLAILLKTPWSVLTMRGAR